MMFFTMLFMYSAFVLTSIATEFYVKDIAKLFEYYVYFWGAGDLIEELICCFVSLEEKKTYDAFIVIREGCKIFNNALNQEYKVCKPVQ